MANPNARSSATGRTVPPTQGSDRRAPSSIQAWGCRITPAPEGGLLVRGIVGGNRFKGTPKLLLLTAAGTSAAGFGKSGSVSLPRPAGTKPGEAWQVEGTVFQPGGGLVVAGGGELTYDSGGVATLLGLAANGARNPAFGSGGAVVQPTSPASWTSPRAMVALPDGELIVSGMTDSGRAARHPFWMRFGRGGKLIRSRSGAAFVAPLAYPAGRLIPAGPERVYVLMNHLGGTIAELKADGTPVGGFGEDGLAQLPEEFRAGSIVADPDGGVTALGSARDSGRIAAYRLDAAGLPDRSFGRDGLASVRARGAARGVAEAGVVLPGGDVLVLGSVEGKRFGAVLLGPHGHPRRGFGHDGLLACRCGGIRPSRLSAVLHRGDVYVLDHGVGAGGEGSDLIKVDPAGRLDRSFARRGWRKVQIGGNSVALFARGSRLLAVGQNGTSAALRPCMRFISTGRKNAPTRPMRRSSPVAEGVGRGSRR